MRIIECDRCHKSNSQQDSAKSDDPMDGFMNIPDGIDEELPFA